MANILTVLEAINLSEDYLKKKKVDEARINAELLLADILNCRRLDLYLKFDRPLSVDERDKYREFLRRRGEREPLQYIIGHAEFYGLKIFVDKNVLIPRPETEILVEKVLDELSKSTTPLLLDIGTGSGNIPIAILKNHESARAIAIDISDNSLEIARKNAKVNNVEDRIEFLKIDIFDDEIFNLSKFDFIVSNPPYIEKDRFDKLEPELKNYEPRTALTDESDGYRFYRRITSVAKEMLKPGGKLFFEISEGQSKEVQSLMSDNGFRNIEVIYDLQKLDRIVKGEV